jgi:hypothetical protein
MNTLKVFANFSSISFSFQFSYMLIRNKIYVLIDFHIGAHLTSEKFIIS